MVRSSPSRSGIADAAGVEPAGRRSRTLEGMLWMAAALLLGTAVDVLIRIVGTGVPTVVTLFLRCALSPLILLPAIVWLGPGSIRARRPLFHAMRAVLFLSALGGVYWTLPRMPYAAYTTLLQTEPLFVSALAVVILGERLTWRRFGAAILGFIGVMVVFRPDFAASFGLPAAVALASSLMMALAAVVVKRMSASETSLSNLFWFAVIGALVMLPEAARQWQPLSAAEFAMIAAIALGATLCHGCIFRAFQAADASAVAPVGYLGLPIGLSAAILLFGEAPGPSLWLGGAIILAACIWVARGR
jgi:drug/metabolite transporter (DMT)-like permease